MAVVISGPPKLGLQIHELLTLPLSAEAQIVQTSEYRRTAASIGIVRHPRSNRAAPWVGRALGVDFVLLIDGVKERNAAGVQYFIGVRLLRSAGGPPLHEQRYFLPEGLLTPSTAEAILGKLVPAIRPSPQNPAGSFVDSEVAAPRPVARPPISAPPTGPAAAPARPRATPKPQAKPQKPYGRRGWLTVGPALAWRRASLAEPDAPSPAVVYGAGHGLGRPLAGGSGAFGLFWGRIGIEGGVQLYTGKQSSVMGAHRDVGAVRQLHLQTVVALELLPSGTARLGPRVGLVHDRLPIDLGPFVGLSYTAPTLGAHFATPMWRKRLQLRGNVDGIFLGRMALEARRAGVPRFASGVKGALMPRLCMGRWHLEATLGLDFRAAQFRGPTALFSHARYQALSLSDTHLHVGVALGGTL